MLPPSRFVLDPRLLESIVTQATWDRGLGVYRNQQVLDCRPRPADPGTWKFEGEVRGSGREVYAVAIAVSASPQGVVNAFSGHCTCPVGFNCKHSVALLVKAAYKAGAVQAVAASPTAAAPAQRVSAEEVQARQAALARQAQEREHQQAMQRVALWLGEFAASATEAPPQDDHAGPVPGDDEERFVYMLVPARERGLPVLQLGMGLSRRLRSGKWAKVRQPPSLDLSDAAPEDHDIARLIASLATRSFGYAAKDLQGVVAGQRGLLAVQLAAASGRLFSISAERVLDRPLAWGPARGVEWAWREAPGPTPDEPLWSLQPRLPDAGSASWFANTPPLYLDPAAGCCGPLEMPGVRPAQLALFFQAPPMPQSSFALHEKTLLRRLAGLPLPPVLQPPRVLQGIVPVPHLRVAAVPATERDRYGLLRATLRFDYGGLRHFRHDMASPVVVDVARPSPPAGAADPGAERVLLHRDLAAERSAHDVLGALGLAGTVSGDFHLPATEAHRWLPWLDSEFAPLREAGFVLEIEPALGEWIARADTLDVRLSPRGGDPEAEDLAGADDSRSPWFDLSLGIAIAGERRNILPLLPELLAQLAPAGGADAGPTADRQPGVVGALPPHVYLPQADGTWLRLPVEPLRPWLQALLDLVGERLGPLQGDTLRLSRLEALRVGAALGDGARWQGADSLRHMVQQLAGRSALPEVAVPAGLLAQLRPYQQQGLEWLQFLRANGLGGVLADDMGLGKTLQTLAHVLVEKDAGRLDRPALIIAPVTVLGNWRREAARFAPDLRTVVLHGKERHEAAADMARYDLVIAPYSLLQRDRARWLQQPWHLVVLDEAQNIKNASTHAAQVVGELDTRHRLCLSGTPMENHLGELWSLFHFLMPGFLGSQARFRDLFRTPIEKQGNAERLAQLRRRVTPFMLRRTKQDVATDLPEKQEAVTGVELGEQQADLYETIRLATEKAVREALATKGLAQSQIQVLDALLKLRQVCCDPRLVPVAAAKKVRQSAKLELLMELLPELLAEGRRVLLFSQFTAMLELIEQELAARDIPWVKLTGQSQRRDALIERFTSGEVPLFLISLKAGGVGLNLTQADTVIHYDPWWNPAVEKQATDRAHRIGQTQRVLVYKLVAQGTIEERILALQERKAALADSMYSDAAARKQPLFTEGDLAELLKPLG